MQRLSQNAMYLNELTTFFKARFPPSFHQSLTNDTHTEKLETPILTKKRAAARNGNFSA